MLARSCATFAMVGNQPPGQPPGRPGGPPPKPQRPAVPAGGRQEPPPKPRVLPPPRPAAGAPPPPSPAVSVAAAREQETLLAPERAQSVTHERVKAQVPSSGAAGVPSGREPDKYIGTTIDGRYVVESVLGEGGMGVVYKCKRKVFDRPAALKILRADLAKNTEVLDRFVTEAKAASGIGNDHIVDVFDFGEVPDGSTYFAMEYLEGETLGARVSKGRFAAEQVVRLGCQMAEGLAAAHAAQIVHRDLKPDNVFIIQRDGQDFIKILDFGIAKVIGIDNKITRAGAVFGTPHYMSPEQCRGSPVDHRTDIYSLGVLLYEMTVGRVPFDAENPLTILSMHLNETPKRFAEAVPGIELPAGLENLVLKCLAKQPDDRFGSMREVEQALAAIERGEAVEIEVPISIAPPEDELPVPVVVPPTSTAPFGGQVSAGPTSVRDGVPSSDPARASFVGDVRPSLPDGRLSLAGVPSSADLVEEQLRRAAEAADAEREWAKSGGRRRWPVVVGVIALAAVAAVVVFVVLSLHVETMGEAFQPARSLLLGSHVQAREAAPGDEVKVALVLSPIDAHVYRAGRDLGTMPVEVPVKQGERVEIEVKREGYWSRKLTLDADKPKVTIRLAPITGGKGLAAKHPGGDAKGAPEKAGAEPAPAPAPEPDDSE
ncbi:MAG: hypothetical protein AMXMBFR56_60110 [Polyangiaceae bacterium]